MAKGGAGKQNRKKHKSADRQSSAPTAAERGRADRRNTANQLRQQARAKAISAHRTAAHVAPKVVSLVAAGATSDTAALAQLLLAQSETGASAATMSVAKQRQRLTLLQPARTIAAVLDAAKATDVLLLAIPAEGGMDALGEQVRTRNHISF